MMDIPTNYEVNLPTGLGGVRVETYLQTYIFRVLFAINNIDY